MDKRSPMGRAEEWRQQWLSGHALCRSSIGAAYSGFVGCAVRHTYKGQRLRVAHYFADSALHS